MIKVLLVLGAITLALSYEIVQLEKGQESSIHYAMPPIHILQQGSGISVPRFVDVEVSFTSVFRRVPQVLISVYNINFAYGQPSGFDVQVVRVTLIGFTLRYTAVSPNQLYGVLVNWMAVFDPSLEMFEIYANALGLLSMESSDFRKVDFTVPFNSTYLEVPTVALFLTGVQFTKRNPIIFLQVTDVNLKSFTVTATTWYTCVITFIRFNALVGPSSVLMNNQVSFRVPQWQSPLSDNTIPSSRSQTLDQPINDVRFQSGARTTFMGLSGFDAEESIDIRLAVAVEYEKTKATVTFTTWWDSSVYQVEVSSMLYIPDRNRKIFNPLCAEIFSECNYEGDSMTICDNENNLALKGWNKKVKSIQIPNNKVLKVYNQEDFMGALLRFETSNSCIELLKFTFAQLQQDTQ